MSISLGNWIEIGILIVTVFVLIYAIKTMKIASKSRRDTFLPVIISNKPFASFYKYNDIYNMTFYLTNTGHGLALRPEISLVDKNNNIMAQAVKLLDGHTQDNSIVDFMDYRVAAGSYQYGARLGKEDPRKLLDKIKLQIKYRDIFNRIVQTQYNLESSSNNEHIKLGGYILILPK